MNSTKHLRCFPQLNEVSLCLNSTKLLKCSPKLNQVSLCLNSTKLLKCSPKLNQVSFCLNLTKYYPPFPKPSRVFTTGHRGHKPIHGKLQVSGRAEALRYLQPKPLVQYVTSRGENRLVPCCCLSMSRLLLTSVRLQIVLFLLYWHMSRSCRNIFQCFTVL